MRSAGATNVGASAWVASATCKSQVANLQQEIGAIAATCQYDIIRFCSDVQPGGGRVATCLQDHRDDLSPECNDRLPKKK